MTWEPGTALEAGLNAIGITQDRYLDLKEAIGLPRDCNCPARKQWLNDAWAWAVSQGIEKPRPKRKCRRGKKRTPAEEAARLRMIEEGQL